MISRSKHQLPGNKVILLVPIEANCLTVLCDYILQDVSGCLDKDKKRQYVQSGRFKKKGKVFGDKADDD